MTGVDTSIRFEPINNTSNDQGKNSTNFIAKDLQLDTKLFMKKISKESLNKQGIKIEDYFLEARLLYKGKHTNIAEIQYASQDEKSIYLAMPLYENGSLSSLMDSRYLTVREIIKYSLDFLSGLAYIHSKEMVHLDIKPTNILLDNTNRAILTDFGLSRILNEHGTAEQNMNYAYIRDPQSFEINKRSIESDIYQVGTLLYRMCNGNDVLKKQCVQLKINDIHELRDNVINGKFPIRKYYLPHIPNKLQKIVEKCLEVNLNKRYNNVISIMNDLSDIDEHLDWKYSPYDEFIYTKIEMNEKIEKSKEFVIKIENLNNKFNIICMNGNLEGKNRRRINKCCFDNLDVKEVTKNLKEIIKEIN
ncbi:MAG: serine/threonine-protein kinase [Clostridium beijerinckii]